MLNELLTELKQAINNRDNGTAKRIIKTLNQNGMDNYTISILLKEI